MAISASEILTAVNNNLERTETNIDTEIRAALKLLSSIGDFLEHKTTDTLSAGTTSINYPTDYKRLQALRLNDGSTDGMPLIPITQGEYFARVANKTSADRAEPTHYAEFYRKFWPAPISDGNYTATLWFWRYHPDSVSTIYFTDEFEPVIFSLATFYTAAKFGVEEYMAKWRLASIDQILALTDDETAQKMAKMLPGGENEERK